MNDALPMPMKRAPDTPLNPDPTGRPGRKGLRKKFRFGLNHVATHPLVPMSGDGFIYDATSS